MPSISQRTNSLGTENAFVVLAEVTALQRQGKDIILFCIGQPDFPTPEHVQNAAIEAIRGGKHGYTPSAGIAELPLRRREVDGRVPRSRHPRRTTSSSAPAPSRFIAYAIQSTTDYGVGDEVIYPTPGFPIY